MLTPLVKMWDHFIGFKLMVLAVLAFKTYSGRTCTFEIQLLLTLDNDSRWIIYSNKFESRSLQLRNLWLLILLQACTLSPYRYTTWGQSTILTSLGQTRHQLLQWISFLRYTLCLWCFSSLRIRVTSNASILLLLRIVRMQMWTFGEVRVILWLHSYTRTSIM